MKKTTKCISTSAEKQWLKTVNNFAEDLNPEDVYQLYAKKRREFVKRYKELPTTESENHRLLSLKDKYKGERIFLIGNGPSLNNTPLELLEGEYTFGVNRIYLLFDRINWRPSFYTVNDWEVGPDNALEINELKEMTFFFPTRFRGLFKKKQVTYWYNARNRRNKNDVFNYDLTDGAVMGGTVMSLVMQIAYFMGFDPVYLIGTDVDYKINKTVRQDGKLFPDGNKQFLQSTINDDPNHFDPKYFGKGRRWHNPNVGDMTDGFAIARKAFEDKGRRIYNATVGGKLEVLERVDFKSLFRKTKIKPTVSVIMPAYNAEKYINKAIRSVINQSFSNWELIIVNDGSTDGTKNIISSYSDSRISCINQENKGRAGARNSALRRAKGEYIAFLDADDLYIPTKLEKQLKFFADNKPADIVVGGFNRISQNGHIIRQNLQQDTRKIPIKSFFLGCPAHLIATMIRRNAIDGHFFDPNAKAGEDWDFFLRLAMNDFQFYKQNEIVSCYRMTDQAIKKTSKQYATYMVGVLDRVFSKLPADIKYSKYKNEAYLHTNMRMAARLFSTEQYEHGKLFFEAAGSFADKHDKKFYRFAANQICFWLKHIDADRPEKYIKQIKKVLQNKFDTTKLSKYCYDLLSIKDKSCIQDLDSNILIGPHPFNSSAHYDETKSIFQLFLKDLKGNIMIDVGAHIGSSSIPFLNNKWRIFAFEPDIKNRTQLLKRLSENGYADNIIVDPRAVSNTSRSEVTYYCSDVSAGISSLSAFHETHKSDHKVDVITLSEYLVDKEGSHVDFLKIDTEGHDLFVMQGFPWERFKPAVIECEFEDSKSIPLGYTFQDQANFLMDKGYQVYVSEWHPIVRYGTRHNWKCLKRYPCQLSNERAWGNLLAFRDSIDDAVVVNAVKKTLKFYSADGSATKKMTDPQAGLANSEFQFKGIKLQFIKRLYRRFANYIVDNYPAMGRIGFFGVWSLRTLKKQMLGLGGITFLSIAGFFVAAYFFENYRWLLSLTGGGLALLLAGVFGVAYARYLFRNIREIQQNELKFQVRHAINDSQARFETRFQFEVQKMHQELNEVIKESVQQAGQELQVLRDRFEKKAEELADGLKQINKKEVETQKALEKLHNESRQALEKSQKALSAHRDIISKANFLNVGIYQRFNRYLQNEHSQKILDFWRPNLALEKLDRRALGYLAHSICQIENNCSGRLATSIEDAILRTLVAQSVRSKKLEILEIGILFGIGLAVIYDNCRGRFDRIHLTAIDPLEGYYEDSAYDIITKAPINRAIFEHNMRIADIPKKSVLLIQALSNEKKAQDAAAKRSYSILIIDGDHSYDGVKFDFENYHQMVKRGGYIIFDDYNSKEWPDVTGFVDKEVKNRTDVKLVGSDWRTAVFKVVKKRKSRKAISK